VKQTELAVNSEAVDDEFSEGYRRAVDDLFREVGSTGICYHCSARIPFRWLW
jgi:hypothetical protein